MLKIQKVSTCICSGFAMTWKTVKNVFPINSSLKSDQTGTNVNACKCYSNDKYMFSMSRDWKNIE